MGKTKGCISQKVEEMEECIPHKVEEMRGCILQFVFPSTGCSLPVDALGWRFIGAASGQVIPP